jgi:hypothetical protein
VGSCTRAGRVASQWPATRAGGTPSAAGDCSRSLARRGRRPVAARGAAGVRARATSRQRSARRADAAREQVAQA